METDSGSELRQAEHGLSAEICIVNFVLDRGITKHETDRMDTISGSDMSPADHGLSAEVLFSGEPNYGARLTAEGGTEIHTCLKQCKPTRRTSIPKTFRVKVFGLKEGDTYSACPMSIKAGTSTTSEHAYFCTPPFRHLKGGEFPQKMLPVIATQATEEIVIALVFDGEKQEKLVITITVQRGTTFFSVDCKQSVSVRQLRAQSRFAALHDTP
jgi:hypothetical protein